MEAEEIKQRELDSPLPILPRLDRLDSLVQLVEERYGILATAKSRQCCCCVVRKTEAQDHCKDLPSAIEEVRHKGTLLERVQRLENRVLQLSIEMGIGRTSRSSSSTSMRAAAPQNSEQGLDDRSNDVNPQEDKRCPEVETCVRNTQGNGERLFPRKTASSYKKWVPWFQLGCSPHRD
ncbi:hypothetical protein K2173_004925 [Erythroxylum novogranatense]|uniref:Uncharacterized protein n=1 Tax=Erythroxylum novogranatense TaxID=1862640 RepID=A0AAV8TB49_9ROSI|nr:hypothetical protein K2173_004925 [Erythroxylum novogranatense]